MGDRMTLTFGLFPEEAAAAPEAIRAEGRQGGTRALRGQLAGLVFSGSQWGTAKRRGLVVPPGRDLSDMELE